MAGQLRDRKGRMRGRTGPGHPEPAEIAEDGRSITVVAEHGDCDDGPSVEVLEAGGSVVLMASVRGMTDGPCSDTLRREEVTVKLNRPPGGLR